MKDKQIAVLLGSYANSLSSIRCHIYEAIEIVPEIEWETELKRDEWIGEGEAPKDTFWTRPSDWKYKEVPTRPRCIIELDEFIDHLNMAIETLTADNG